MGEVSNLIKNRFKTKEVTLKEIIKEIENHQSHGTESNPEQYGQIFFNILMLAKVPKNDLERYSRYVIGWLQGEIKKETER